MLIYFILHIYKALSWEIIVINWIDIMNIIFKKRIIRRSYPNIHLHIMFGHFKKSASILTDQDTQMVGNDRWPATICSADVWKLTTKSSFLVASDQLMHVECSVKQSSLIFWKVSVSKFNLVGITSLLNDF